MKGSVASRIHVSAADWIVGQCSVLPCQIAAKLSSKQRRWARRIVDAVL